MQVRSDTAFSSMSSAHLGLQRPSVSLLRISTTGPASAQRPAPARFPRASKPAQAQPAGRVTPLEMTSHCPLTIQLGVHAASAILWHKAKPKLPTASGPRLRVQRRPTAEWTGA